MADESLKDICNLKAGDLVQKTWETSAWRRRQNRQKSNLNHSNSNGISVTVGLIINDVVDTTAMDPEVRSSCLPSTNLQVENYLQTISPVIRILWLDGSTTYEFRMNLEPAQIPTCTQSNVK